MGATHGSRRVSLDDGEKGKRVLRINPASWSIDVLLAIEEVVTDGQAGLLGMALHPDLGKNTGMDYVYLSYTYNDEGFKQKIVRYDYSIQGDDGELTNPMDIISGLPASVDHNSGRLLIGEDQKLYYSIGDQGRNQFGSKCLTIQSQDLPQQSEVDANDFSQYPGKVLRINLDGSIPEDNPTFAGVQSHIYSIGHRNPSGMVFGSNGKLYSSEHGPKTDDELNLIEPGKNYGWPHVAGFKDDKAYKYCIWSSLEDCESASFTNFSYPAGATLEEESSWNDAAFTPPLRTFFTVDNNHDFLDVPCSSAYICFPSIAPSSVTECVASDLADFENTLLISSLKKEPYIE